MHFLPRAISVYNFEGILDRIPDIMYNMNILSRFVLYNTNRTIDQYILRGLTYLSNTLPIVIEHLSNLSTHQEQGQLIANYLTCFLEQINIFKSFIISRFF